MCPEDRRNEQTGQGESVADLLEEGTGRAESRGRDVLSGVVVDNTANDLGCQR